MISVLAEPPRYSCGRSMRAIETTPAASLNVGEEVALVGRAQWETNWTALHMRSVQAWRAHHQQPWQPARKIGLSVFLVTGLPTTFTDQGLT